MLRVKDAPATGLRFVTPSPPIFSLPSLPNWFSPLSLLRLTGCTMWLAPLYWHGSVNWPPGVSRASGPGGHPSRHHMLDGTSAFSPWQSVGHLFECVFGCIFLTHFFPITPECQWTSHCWRRRSLIYSFSSGTKQTATSICACWFLLMYVAFPWG